MLDVGVRIELYETVGAAGDASTAYAGAFVRDYHFRLAAVPAVGELVSSVSLATSQHRIDPAMRTPVLLEDPQHAPFLAVRQVEHYLTPADPEHTSPLVKADPGPVLVFHAQLPHPDLLPELVAAYQHDGWAVMPAGLEGPLQQAWTKVIAAAG